MHAPKASSFARPSCPLKHLSIYLSGMSLLLNHCFWKWKDDMKLFHTCMLSAYSLDSAHLTCVGTSAFHAERSTCILQRVWHTGVILFSVLLFLLLLGNSVFNCLIFETCVGTSAFHAERSTCILQRVWHTGVILFSVLLFLLLLGNSVFNCLIFETLFF